MKKIIALLAFIISAHSVKSQKTFDLIKQYPRISDTTAFINKLVETYPIYVHQIPEQKISYYKKIKLYGSDKEYILLEYDFIDGSMASFPWKNQYLFTKEGRLIKMLSAKRFQFLKVFSNQNPYLFIANVTAKGNGSHELYRIHADTLQNVLDEYEFKTYDIHEDNAVFEKGELSTKVADENKDGFNDLVFYGTIIFIQRRLPDGTWVDGVTENGKTTNYSVTNPWKKAPVKFVFLYNNTTGHFRSKENYIKKYAQYYY